MADGADDGDGEVAGVAETGHYDCEPEKFGRRAADEEDQVADCAAGDGREEDVYRDEPPAESGGQRNGLTEVDEDKTGEEEDEDELAQEAEGRAGDDLDSPMGEGEAD